MKKLASVLIAGALAFSLSGCIPDTSAFEAKCIERGGRVFENTDSQVYVYICVVNNEIVDTMISEV